MIRLTVMAAVLAISQAAVAAPMLPSLPPVAAASGAIAPPQVEAKASILMDFQSGRILQAQNEHVRMAPASLTKIMAAYVVYSAIHDGRLKMDQVVPVSENAWRTGGSKMFISMDKPVTVEELIKGMIIQSGNDATVALAEAVAGSEATFAQLMNAMAKRLGMNNTHFVTANGLPDPNHYSTAYDMAILTRALIRDFPDHYKYESAPEYTYNGIRQGNRNILLPIPGNRYGYPGADGVKTGHTEEAGFCLVGSAKRDNMRLISVVMGAKSMTSRAVESAKLLNYGFQMFENRQVLAKGQKVGTLAVENGKEPAVDAVAAETVSVLLQRGQAGQVQSQFVAHPTVPAPVKAGQRLGVLRLSAAGAPLGEYPVVAARAVEEAGFFGKIWLWLKGLLGL